MSKEKELWFNATPHYNENPETYEVGPYFSHFINHDPKHLVFTLSRYKFAMKMLKKSSRVLELGCSDGFGSLVLKERASFYMGVDFDDRVIAWAQRNLQNEQRSFQVGDILTDQFGKFDAIVSLDVIEHIYPENQDGYMLGIMQNLAENGIAIVGTPNITAEQYSSSDDQHVNLFTGDRLVETFEQYFHNVFHFGMNDEVLHTGYSPMCHYLFVVAANPKQQMKK